MKVSVVLCTYAESMYEDFTEAAESILSQDYDDVELVVVVDGDNSLHQLIKQDMNSRENVILHCNNKNLGLSKSRNVGVELSSGDVVAFIDDDAVSDPEWIDELVSAYEQHNAIAVGGKMIPRWVAGKPSFLPEEFYWLVGVTHRGFADGPGEVRNTFGSNISFRSGVFEELGGFDADMGRQGDKNLQSEETLLCAEMQTKFGKGVWYNPNAVVEHKVFKYRTEFCWLVDRAFWQGYSKRAMESFVDNEGGEEKEFLNQMIIRSVPERLRGLIFNRSLPELERLICLFIFTAAVGLGYLYAIVDH